MHTNRSQMPSIHNCKFGIALRPHGYQSQLHVIKDKTLTWKLYDSDTTLFHELFVYVYKQNDVANPS